MKLLHIFSREARMERLTTKLHKFLEEYIAHPTEKSENRLVNECELCARHYGNDPEIAATLKRVVMRVHNEAAEPRRACVLAGAIASEASHLVAYMKQHPSKGNPDMADSLDLWASVYWKKKAYKYYMEDKSEPHDMRRRVSYLTHGTEAAAIIYTSGSARMKKYAQQLSNLSHQDALDEVLVGRGDLVQRPAFNWAEFAQSRSISPN